MKKKLVANRLIQYLTLLIILSLMVLFFFLAHGHRQLQFKIVVLASFIYVIWGAVYHFLNKTLYPKVVVEYIAVAALAIVILGGLLL